MSLAKHVSWKYEIVFFFFLSSESVKSPVFRAYTLLTSYQWLFLTADSLTHVIIFYILLLIAIFVFLFFLPPQDCKVTFWICDNVFFTSENGDFHISVGCQFFKTIYYKDFKCIFLIYREYSLLKPFLLVEKIYCILKLYIVHHLYIAHASNCFNKGTDVS